MTMTLDQAMQCARNLAIGSDSLLSQCLDVIDVHIAGMGEAVACRYRFGDGNGGWLGWICSLRPAIKTVYGDAVQVEPLYTQPAQPAACSGDAGRQGEAVGYTQMTVGGYAVATLHAHALNLPDGTKLYTHPAAPVGVPDGWVEVVGDALKVIKDVDQFGMELPVSMYRNIKPRLEALLAAAPSAPQGETIDE